MEHANLAWLTLALCASISLLVCGARAAASARLRRAFCFFHGSFGLLLATHLVNRYLALNLPGSDPNLLAFVRYLENPALLLVLAVAAPVLVHELTDCPQRAIRNLLSAGLALAMLFLNYSISLFHTRGDATRILIKDGLFILIVAYCMLLLVRAWQRERDTNVRRRRRRTALIMSALFPAIIADTFFDASLEFKFFPIVHLVFGIDLFGYLDVPAPAQSGRPTPPARLLALVFDRIFMRKTEVLPA